jgi:hypothetical protein
MSKRTINLISEDDEFIFESIHKEETYEAITKYDEERIERVFGKISYQLDNAGSIIRSAFFDKHISNKCRPLIPMAKYRKFVDSDLTFIDLVKTGENKKKMMTSQFKALKCTDIMTYICQFLNLKDIRTLSTTCKDYKNLINNMGSYHSISPKLFDTDSENYYARLEKMLNYNPILVKNINYFKVSLNEHKNYDVIDRVLKTATKIKKIFIAPDYYEVDFHMEQVISNIFMNNIKYVEELKFTYIDINFFQKFMSNHPEFSNTTVKKLKLRSCYEDDSVIPELPDIQAEKFGDFIALFKNLEILDIENITPKHFDIIMNRLTVNLKELRIKNYADYDNMFNDSLELIKRKQKNLEVLDLCVMPYLDELTFTKGDFPELKKLDLGFVDYITDYDSDEFYDRLNLCSIVTNRTIDDIITHLPKLESVYIDGVKYVYERPNYPDNNIIYDYQMIDFDKDSIMRLLASRKLKKFVVFDSCNLRITDTDLQELEEYIEFNNINIKFNIDIDYWINRTYGTDNSEDMSDD